tara:strand:+ start:829 stop:1164 length:336 start_codon:yes stop_codon:yes gene_type:complete
MIILLSDKQDIINDIEPALHELETPEEAHELIIYWLENKNFNGSVFVLFDVNIIDGVVDIREAYNFLVSNTVNDIMTRINNSVRPNNVFGILEASDYDQAFNMCLDINTFW